MSARCLITAVASGMVGGYALKICLDNKDVNKVTAIGRRGVGIQDPKLHQVHHDDYSDYGAKSKRDHLLAERRWSRPEREDPKPPVDCKQ